MMSPLRCSRDTRSHVPEIWHISVVLAVQGISINPSILPMGILMGRLSLHSMSSNLWMLLLQFCFNLCVQCCCWYHVCGLSITCLSNGLLRICFVGVYARHLVISYHSSNDRGNVHSIFISLVPEVISYVSNSDGFILNVGNLNWQPSQVASAYTAAMGTNFKLFMSFNMMYMMWNIQDPFYSLFLNVSSISSLPCGDSGSADLLCWYINDYATHLNQLYYEGKQVMSTFAGEWCTFGQGDLNDGWDYAVKQGVSSSISLFQFW